MNEIYKLTEYDLIDIQFSDSMSKLKLFLIWSEYEESRVTIEIEGLIHALIEKPSPKSGKNKQELPFFVEKIVLSETFYPNKEIQKMITLKSLLGANEMTQKLYHLKVECVEMVLEAVGLHVAVHDPASLYSTGLLHPAG